MYTRKIRINLNFKHRSRETSRAETEQRETRRAVPPARSRDIRRTRPSFSRANITIVLIWKSLVIPRPDTPRTDLTPRIMEIASSCATCASDTCYICRGWLRSGKKLGNCEPTTIMTESWWQHNVRLVSVLRSKTRILLRSTAARVEVE